MAPHVGLRFPMIKASMTTANPKECLMCGSPDYDVVFSYDTPDDIEKSVGVGEKDYFRKWVRCQKCGLYYSLYSREKEAMNNVYVAHYRDNSKSWRKEGSAKEVFEKVVALPEQESVTKSRITWIKENIRAIWDGGLLQAPKAPHRMLDIGGGTGIFAYEFQDKDWTSAIIDPSEGNNFIETDLHMPLVRDFYKPNTFPQKFDLVALIYLLEHVLDPIAFLNSVREDLHQNSFLFVEVPDAITFEHRPQTDDIFHSEHLWLFDPKTLHGLLERCGFELFALKRMKTKRDHYVMMALAAKK